MDRDSRTVDLQREPPDEGYEPEWRGPDPLPRRSARVRWPYFALALGLAGALAYSLSSGIGPPHAGLPANGTAAAGADLASEASVGETPSGGSGAQLEMAQSAGKREPDPWVDAVERAGPRTDEARAVQPVPLPEIDAVEQAVPPQQDAPFEIPAESDAPRSSRIHREQALLGTHTVQLGSLRSAQDAVARWERLQAEHPDLLGSHWMYVMEVDLGARGRYYRVRVGPFADLRSAQRLCRELESRSRECLAVRN